MSVWERAVGEGQGVFLEGNQEGILIRDLEGVGGGALVSRGEYSCVRNYRRV